MTEIATILDRSGSMVSLTEPAIAGFNQFLADQQAAPGEARISLILFDDEYSPVYESIPIAEAVPLDTTTFVPRGSTALLDAVGRTIDRLGKRLAHLPAAERPDTVIVAILTDGEENSSRRYTYAKIAGKIRHQREKYAWQFVFLAANQDAIASAAMIDIAAADSLTFHASPSGTQQALNDMSAMVRERRR